MDISKATAETYLTSLLSKTLRITTSDTRLFVGEFKCTDADRNIILSHTYEYRHPSSTSLSSVKINNEQPPDEAAAYEGEENVILDMTSRYLGLVVVPGKYIRKFEVEDFASQVKGGGKERWVLSEGTVKE